MSDALSPGRATYTVLYMALIPGALGIVGQTWAQAHLPPTRTAIVMSMQPVFAGRDEIITLLARSDPASADRLSDLYVAYRKIMNG